VAGSLGEAQLQLTVDDRAFNAGLNKAKASVDGFAGKTQGAFSQIAGALAGIGAGAAVVGLFKDAISQAIELESITKRLTNALGAQGAGKALAMTRKLSEELGLSYKDLANNFARFTAAASAAGVPMAQQQRLFTEVTKNGQALGLSNAELEGSFLALQQVAAKGVVQMEELRGQLGERMPNAFAAAARGMNMTSRELIKLVESGGLDSKTFFDGLSKGLAAFNAEASQGQTSAQRLQGVRNEYDKLMTSLGNEALPLAIAGMQKLRDALKGANTGLEANKLGFDVGLLGALGVMPETASKAAGEIGKLRDQFELTDKEARALWYDALKLQGIKSPAFAKPQELEAAVVKAKELAAAWTKGRIDAKGAALAQQAEEQKLADIALRRSEAQAKLLKPAQDRLQTARLEVTLEGDALKIAMQRLEVDKARAAYNDASSKARAAAPGSPAAAALEVAADAAALDLSTALENAGQAMKSAAKNAADQLKQAGDQLKGTLRSNLDLLNAGMRQRVIDDARTSLNSSLATGRYDTKAITSQIKTNQDLIDMATKLEGINASFDNYSKAQDNVAKVQEQLGVSFSDLGVKLDETASAIIGLASKDWSVYVNGTAVSGFGDMVSAMNRGLS